MSIYLMYCIILSAFILGVSFWSSVHACCVCLSVIWCVYCLTADGMDSWMEVSWLPCVLMSAFLLRNDI